MGLQATPSQHRRIVPSLEICVNSRLPIDVVPCLYQRNVHIKRWLRERRAQKYNPCLGANSPQAATGCRATPSQASPYSAVNGNLLQFEATYRHGTVFAPTQFAYQIVATGKDTQKYNPCVGGNSPQAGRVLQATPSQASPYSGVNGNLLQFEATYRNGTVFSPTPCAYQKVAMGKESPKI